MDRSKLLCAIAGKPWWRGSKLILIQISDGYAEGQQCKFKCDCVLLSDRRLTDLGLNRCDLGSAAVPLDNRGSAAARKMTTSITQPPIKPCPVCRVAMVGPPHEAFDHFECLNCGLLMDYSGSAPHTEIQNEYQP